MNQLLKTIFNFSVLALVACSALGQSTLDVLCLDPSGNPLKKASVMLHSFETNAVKTTKSDGKGQAHFKMLSPGVYRLWGRIDGFAPSSIDFLKIEEGATQEATLHFEEGDSLQLLYFEDQTRLNRSQDLYAQGSEALQNQEIDKAVAALEESIQLNPSNPDTYRNLGIAMIHRQDWEAARENLQKALDLMDYFVIIASEEQRPGFVEAQESMQNILDQIPVMQLGAEADKALQAKDWDKAIGLYEQIISLGNESGGTYYNLALSQLRGNRIEEASKSIDKALEAEPDDDDFKTLRGIIDDYLKNAEAARAKEQLKEIQGLRKAGDASTALEKALALVDQFPAEFRHLLLLETARAYVDLDRLPEAFETYQKVIELSPDQTSVQRELADLYMEHEYYEEAVGTYRSLYTAQGEDPDAKLLELADQFIRKGKTPVAIRIYEQVVKVNPDYAEAYYALGMQRYYENKYAAAKKLLTRYTEIGENKDHLENVEAVLVVIKRAKP